MLECPPGIFDQLHHSDIWVAHVCNGLQVLCPEVGRIWKACSSAWNFHGTVLCYKLNFFNHRSSWISSESDTCPTSGDQSDASIHSAPRKDISHKCHGSQWCLCYLLLPILCCTISSMVDGLRTSFLAAYQVSLFLVLLNSSLNPAVICYRFAKSRK